MGINGTVWKPIGPSPIVRDGGGREDNGLVSTIAVNPNNPNSLYIGTAGGGVWRSQDAGATWAPIFDRQVSLGIGGPGGIAIDPSDTSTIYVGTTGRWTQHLAAGLFRSTDGGSSAIRLGSGYPDGNTGSANVLFNDFINAVIVDPANQQRLYLASNQGAFFSTDGGLNWTMGTNSGGDIRSLVLDTTSPVGARILYAGKTNGGATAGGIFQSVDGGQSWTSIFNAATPALAAAVNALNDPVFLPSFGKVLVGLAPPTSPAAAGGIQVLYASVDSRWLNPPAPPPPPPLPARPRSVPIALFLSTDQGATWTQQTSNGLQNARSSQGGYSFQMAVDPASAGDGTNDIIYLGGQGQVRTSDSGANFTQIGGGDIHADTHCWAFIPQPPGTPTTVLCGTDGGLFRSDDQGGSWTALNGGGLQTSLFYNLDVRRDATASVTIGTLQDNGILTTSGVAAPIWSARGGDGWDAVYDGGPASSRVYGTAGFFSPEPCTRAFRSDSDATDIPSAAPITPWTAAGGDAGCYLASIATDPSNSGIVYIAGDQNLWQSVDSGASWVNLGPFAPFTNPDDPLPAQGRLSSRPAVAPSNGNNLVVAFGGATAANRISVSTNALNTLIGGAPPVTFTDITRNLPGRSILRAVFDPNDPTVIYVVLGGFDNGVAGQTGHVFRTTIAGTQWEDISPDLDVPFGSIALDGSETPTVIYAGTDLGVLRSVDDGNTWTVLDDIHFPGAPVTDMVIGGSGTLRVATYGRGVFEFASADGPAIAINLESGLEELPGGAPPAETNESALGQFGIVCEGMSSNLILQVFNVGTENLVIDSVQRLLGSTSFEVDPLPPTPIIISPGDEIDFSIRYTPAAPGASDLATIRIRSNDPGAPTLDFLVSGSGGVATAELSIADDGDFGDVCLGDYKDLDLTINNSGTCPLDVTQITSNNAAFLVPNVVAFPLVVAPGGSIRVPIRFEPSATGTASAQIRVISNDLDSPATIDVEGTSPVPRLALSIADNGDFGNVCVGDFRDQPLVLTNAGKCKLTVTGITSSSPDFLVPNIDALPITIACGAAVPLALRFQPTSLGEKDATITVASDDPASPSTIDVSGTVPSGMLAITGTTDFGAVELGVRALQTLTLCNTGHCDLHVSAVCFKPPSRCELYRHRCGGGCKGDCGCDCGHESQLPDYRPPEDKCLQKCLNFKLINNPFPAKLHPGSCLGVTIQYIPTCDNAACCELEIETDDPDAPSTTVFVTGHLRRTLDSALKCWAAQELQEILAAGNGC